MLIRTHKSLLLVVLALHCQAVHASTPQCRERPDLVGICFNVRGELKLYDGTPSARIHVANGGRILGITPYIDGSNETFAAPADVRRKASFLTGLTGKFKVCPLNRAMPGRMQTVCVENASQLKIRRPHPKK